MHLRRAYRGMLEVRAVQRAMPPPATDQAQSSPMQRFSQATTARLRADYAGLADKSGRSGWMHRQWQVTESRLDELSTAPIASSSLGQLLEAHFCRPEQSVEMLDQATLVAEVTRRHQMASQWASAGNSSSSAVHSHQAAEPLGAFLRRLRLTQSMVIPDHLFPADVAAWAVHRQGGYVSQLPISAAAQNSIEQELQQHRNGKQGSTLHAARLPSLDRVLREVAGMLASDWALAGHASAMSGRLRDMIKYFTCLDLQFRRKALGWYPMHLVLSDNNV